MFLYAEHDQIRQKGENILISDLLFKTTFNWGLFDFIGSSPVRCAESKSAISWFLAINAKVGGDIKVDFRALCHVRLLYTCSIG